MQLNLSEQSLRVFDAADAASNIPMETVTEVDLSCNALERALKLPRLLHLSRLLLQHNVLSSVPALPRRLRVLNLSHNKLQSCDGLSACEALERVDLSHNQLTQLPCMPQTVTHVAVCSNRLTSLAGVYPPRLVELRATVNRVLDLDGLIAAPRSLKLLWLAGNPVVTASGYREHVAQALPRLGMLDGTPVVHAAPARIKVTVRSKPVARATAPQPASDESLAERALMLRVRHLEKQLRQEEAELKQADLRHRVARDQLRQLDGTAAQQGVDVRQLQLAIQDVAGAVDELECTCREAAREFRAHHSDIQASRSISAI